jgi:hypothetical protein
MLYSTPYIIVKKKMHEPVEILREALFALYLGLPSRDGSQTSGNREAMVESLKTLGVLTKFGDCHHGLAGGSRIVPPGIVYEERHTHSLAL